MVQSKIQTTWTSTFLSKSQALLAVLYGSYTTWFLRKSMYYSAVDLPCKIPGMEIGAHWEFFFMMESCTTWLECKC